MRIINLCLLLFFSILSFGQSNDSLIIEKNMDAIDYPEISKVHPKAKELMNEDFYFSPIDETGPFGSDDASDTYFAFANWRLNNKTKNPKDFIIPHLNDWDYPLFDLSITDYEKLKPYLNKGSIYVLSFTGIDQVILAVAFAQLYLEGEIDQELLMIAENALKRQLIPEILSMWPDNYQEERKDKLNKMMEVIKNLK
jgi:uncharacterized protein YfeS